MKAKKLVSAFLFTILMLGLTGCLKTIKDLTPTEFPQNPSNIYTLVLEVHEKDLGIVNGTLSPKVVIDGESHQMVKSQSLGTNHWEYEYTMPRGRRNAVYYYEIEYEVFSPNGRKQKSITQPKDGLSKFSLVNRYIVNLESTRGPVGASIGINGRGFSQNDQIFVGGTPASAQFYSANNMNFVVPSLPAGKTYDVKVRGERGEMTVGSFKIDPAMMSVTPASLMIKSGARATLIFSIPTAAPAEGLPVTITTNIPSSVILPEVSIAGGDRSVSVPLEGGDTGIGVLYVETQGFAPVEVPIEVTN